MAMGYDPKAGDTGQPALDSMGGDVLAAEARPVDPLWRSSVAAHVEVVSDDGIPDGGGRAAVPEEDTLEDY